MSKPDSSVAGYFQGNGTFDFGNSIQITRTDGILHPFIVKYNSDGLVQWIVTNVSGLPCSFFAMAVTNDSIYAVGRINGIGSVDFGNSIVVNTGFSGFNALIVKYDLSGHALWANSVINATTDSSQFTSISIGNNAVFAVGMICTGQYSFGDMCSIYGSSAGTNCVVVNYSPDGQSQWARTIGMGNSISYFHDVCCSDNELYCCGYLTGYSTVGFGNGVFLDAVGAISPMVVKYNYFGEALWARSFISPVTENKTAVCLAIDLFNGQVNVAGAINRGVYNFGNGICIDNTNNAGNNILLMQYQK